jgi:ribosomal protein L35AE/L33A
MSQVAAEQPKTKPIAKRVTKIIRTALQTYGSELNSLGFRRSKVQQNTNQSILRLEGVNDRSGAQYYFGKRVAYIYKTKSGQKDKRFRVINYLCRQFGDVLADHMETQELC